MLKMYTNKYNIKIFKLESSDDMYCSLELNMKNMFIQVNSSGILLDWRLNDLLIRYHISGNNSLHDLFSERSIKTVHSQKILKKIHWTVHNKNRKVYNIESEDVNNTIHIARNGDVTVFTGLDIMRFNLDDEKR